MKISPWRYFALLFALSSYANAQLPKDAPPESASNTSVFWIAYAKAQISSDAVLQSQRIGKFAPIAVQGDVDAFNQLQTSQQQLDQDLDLLLNGGRYRDKVIPGATPVEQATIEEAKKTWAYSSRALTFLLARKLNVDSYYATLRSMNALSPSLCETTMQVATLYYFNASTPTELSAASHLEMICVRLDRSANLFFVSERINPETAFLLGKDSNTFRDVTNGFLNGSSTLKLPKAKNNEIRSKLVVLQSSFGDYERFVKSILDDLKNLVGVKQAELIIKNENETLMNRLLQMQDFFQRNLDGAV